VGRERGGSVKGLRNVWTSGNKKEMRKRSVTAALRGRLETEMTSRVPKTTRHKGSEGKQT
jgi:hypothetical protein